MQNYQPHYIDGYKLTTSALEKMSTERLLNYIKKILKPVGRSFVCNCCQMFYFDIYPETHSKDKLKYATYQKYKEEVYSILNSRQDIKEVLYKKNKRHQQKTLRNKNSGFQHLKKSKRKKFRSI